MNGKKLVKIQRFAKRQRNREILTLLKCGKSAYQQNYVIQSVKTSNGIMLETHWQWRWRENICAPTHISLYDLMRTPDCLSKYRQACTHARIHGIRAQTHLNAGQLRIQINEQSICQNLTCNPIQSIAWWDCHSLVVNSILLRDSLYAVDCVCVCESHPEKLFPKSIKSSPDKLQEEIRKGYESVRNFCDSHSI